MISLLWFWIGSLLTIIKMPSNSIVKDSIVVGGLTLLGYMAGGKLGSMFGNFLLFY